MEYTETMMAERAMGFEANTSITLEDVGPHAHTHLAIEWAGGVLWLDMSDLGDHYCIDVRQFRGGRLAATGTWAIVNGRRAQLDDYDAEAHGWPAAFMPILIMDKDNPTLEPPRS